MNHVMDSELKILCDVCGGKRYILGMGAMRYECKDCEATGYLVYEPEEVLKEAQEIKVDPIVDLNKIDKRSKAYRDNMRGK